MFGALDDKKSNLDMSDSQNVVGTLSLINKFISECCGMLHRPAEHLTCHRESLSCCYEVLLNIILRDLVLGFDVAKDSLSINLVPRRRIVFGVGTFL